MAVLEVFAASAALAGPDISGDTGTVVGAVAFLAPLLLDGPAMKAASCSLDLATGTVQLSRTAGEDSPAPAQHFAHASVERPGQGMPCDKSLHPLALHRAAARLTVLTALASQSLLADARRPRLQRQRLAQADVGKCGDDTLLPVAPLDATLQLAAVGSNCHEILRQLLIPSGLQACRAPALNTCTISCPRVYWGSAAADGGSRSSHGLTAADGGAAGGTELIGMQFKPTNVATHIRSHIVQSAPSGLGAADVLYELCWAVASPAVPALEDAAAMAGGQCLLRLRTRQPGSSLSAALAALQSLGKADTRHGQPDAHIKPAHGCDQAVQALLRTARLEHPAIGAHLRGTPKSSPVHAQYRLCSASRLYAALHACR